MPAQTTPPVTIAKPQGGVLPISAVTDKSGAQGAAGKNAQTKATPQRTKVVLRRLPPGLTQQELEHALGEEWKPGKGKVAWAEFKAGKVSKDLSKPSKPARCYFQVADQSHLDALSQTVAKASFADARNTANDSALIAPPTLEFAPYGRVPNTKRRNDARQGTIDQDPEFIEFLQSLTEPITTTKGLDASETTKEEPVTVTPLIQHLRDKKAAKEKAASQKAAAKGQKQDAKGDTADAKTENKRAGKEATKPAEEKGKQAKVADKAVKDTIRSPARKGAAAGASPRPQSATPVKPAATASATTTAPPANSAPARRNDASAAARMIQRDLGLRGGRGGTRGGRGGAPGAAANAAASRTAISATAPAEAAAVSPNPVAATPATIASDAATASTPAQATSQARNAPVVQASSSQNQPPAKPPTGPKAIPPKRTPNVSPTATQAFLKHANPSQGITEPLLEQTMSKFGEIEKVEIDKRKGFAYVTFKMPAGLQAAITASPIAVAQGSVQVLERKDRGAGSVTTSVPPPAPSPAVRGRGGFGPVARDGNPVGRGGSFRRGRGGIARGGASVNVAAANGAAVQPNAASVASAAAVKTGDAT